MRGYRKSKKNLVYAGVFLAVLILLAVLLLTLRINTVAVSGNNQYSDEQIEALIFDTKFSRNPLYCYYQDRFQPHKSIPFVEDYRIVFRSPMEVEIMIYEKSVVGYISYMNSMMYFDRDGIIVESSNELIPGIPLVTGLDFGHIVLYRPLPVADRNVFNEILNLTQVLSVYEIQVDRIHFTSDKQARLYIGELEVNLGNNTEMNGKISELRDMLQTYPSLSGILYLDNYGDATSKSGFRIVPK